MYQRVWVLGALLLGLMGCAHQQTRLQSDEDERDKEAEVRTVGDVTRVDNADPIPVMGVGLVVGLEGTGGGAPPGVYKTYLEDYLRKHGVENPKAVLASPTTSLVLVQGSIPPGARKDDKIDLEISLPPQSKTTSLRGGYLKECQLYNYEKARNLSPDYSGRDRIFTGHPVVKAEGPVLVGMGDGDESARLRQARVWGGGRCKLDRPFFLSLNTDQQYARLAQAISDRINERFHGASLGTGDMAAAKSKSTVFVRVPPQYQHNLPRYLRVVRLIPLREDLKILREDRLVSSTGGSVPLGAGSPYRRRLQEELVDPAKTITAALRLEALGNDMIPLLKQGLANEHVLVRFSSAEALAYLGCPACGEELARIVEQQPALRAFALTALASLDEAVSHVKLRELLASSSAETRYGAFRALRALDERDLAVQGDQLNDSFWMHRVAPTAPELVHISTSRRPEVVIFGEEPRLKAPFSIVAGDFTVTAGQADDRCTICRFSLTKGTSRRQCALKLDEVIHAMADMGGLFPDVIELLRQADECKSLSCRVAVDALPQATSVYDLAKSAHKDPDFLQTDSEILNAKADFGATPTLFETGKDRQRWNSRSEEEASLRLKSGSNEKKTAEAKAKSKS